MQQPFKLALALLLIGLVGCAPDARDSSTPTPAFVADPLLVERGIGVYREQYCGVCHQLPAANTRGTFGPGHDGIGLLAAQRVNGDQYNGDATTAEEYLMESLLQPDSFVVEGYAGTQHRMPTYGHLPEADLQALVHMLLSQRQPLAETAGDS